LIKNKLTEKNNKKRFENKLLKDFKRYVDEADLNRLLSHLKKNLYIENGHYIPEKYNNFFRAFTYVEKLKHLDDLEFFIPQSSDDSGALAVYTNKKIDKNYNLLHWLEHISNEKLNHYPGPDKSIKPKTSISVLKPEISFYILEKYFEDIVEKILNKLELDFISNVVIKSDKNTLFEIDFIVFHKNKIFLIEAKTKMNKDNIYEFSRNSSKILKGFRESLDDNFNMDFVLISNFSDRNVDNYQYFAMDSMERKEGFGTTSYNFELPISNSINKMIRCVAEPENKVLEERIRDIICPQ